MIEQPGGRTDDGEEVVVDERGVTLTRAGIRAAGRRIAESRARHDSAYFAALRERLGMAGREP